MRPAECGNSRGVVSPSRRSGVAIGGEPGGNLTEMGPGGGSTRHTRAAWVL